MLRAGRFRHRLLDEAFLKNLGPLAFRCLQKFLPLWEQKQISDMEMAGIYILIFSFLRRPKDFLGGAHSEPPVASAALASITGAEVVARLREVLPANLGEARSLSRLDSSDLFLPHFCSLSWRSIPASAPKSLGAWLAGKYPLRLLTTLPSPHSVLLMQTQGVRCVSMLIQEPEILSFVAEGRDVFGFIIHDLIHADHFFSDEEKAQAQILFSQKLLQVLEIPEIQQMLASDPDFESEFHYLMSDMNSVPLHLLKTLKAILLGHYKRKVGVPLDASLPKPVEASFITLFESVLEPWQLSSEARDAALRLNTLQYKGLEDAALLHKSLTTKHYAAPTIFC